MTKEEVDIIAKIIYENHEEQCCNCGDWETREYGKCNFIRPAEKIAEWIDKNRHRIITGDPF